jgi:spore germination cell wall hydrolase CwlJ-like protein
MNRMFSDEAIAVATLWAEARSEPLEGKVAVAEVILNRMKMSYFSNGTVAGTVFRPLQFSCFNHDNKWRNVIFELDWDSPAVKECREAWRLAQAGPKTVGDAVLYHTIAQPAGTKVWPPRWATDPRVQPVKTITRHIFYEDRG